MSCRSDQAFASGLSTPSHIMSGSPTPKAPKPRHNMSSPELNRHADRRRHKSSTKKTRASSADTFCGVANCRHCPKRETSPRSSAPNRSLTGTPSSSAHGRPVGRYKGQRVVPKTKRTQSLHHKGPRASKSSRSMHNRPSSTARGRSTGVLSSRRHRNRARTLSRPRSPTVVGGYSSDRTLSHGMRSASAQPDHSHTATRLTSPVYSASGSLSPSHSPRKSYTYSDLKEHAHCNKRNCTLRRQYHESGFHGSRHSSPSPAPETYEDSQRRWLGWPKHCICTVHSTVPGETPERPEHEESPAYFMKPLVLVSEDGDIEVTDAVGGVCYIFYAGNRGRYSKNGTNPTACFKAVDALYFDPSRPDTITLGYHCPCYDEFHGKGASAHVIGALEKKGKQLDAVQDRQGNMPSSVYPEYRTSVLGGTGGLPTGFTIPQYPMGILGGSETGEAFTRAVDIFKGRYRASFPWLDGNAAEQKAQEDVYWLGDQCLLYGQQSGMVGWVDDYDLVKDIGAQLWDASGWFDA